MALRPDEAEHAEGTGRGRLLDELRPMLALAGPVVLGELAWMGMALADTIMVGRLGAEAIAAVGLGNVLYFTPAIFGYGMLLGLDTVVSRAFGARRVDDCRRSIVHGIYLAAILTPIVMLTVELVTRGLAVWGVDPGIVRLAVPYLRALNWGTLPLFLFSASRRYLQAMNLVGPALFAMVSANVVNVAGNWVLVYGHLGSPALGVVGSGWATCLARAWMAGVLIAYALWEDRHRGAIPLRFEWGRMRELLGLGLPAAGQITLEVGVFAVAATLAGRLGPTALAAHEV